MNWHRFCQQPHINISAHILMPMIAHVCPCIGRAWNSACCPSTNARALLETCDKNTMVLHTLSFHIASGGTSEGTLQLRPVRECLMPALSDASCRGQPFKSAPEAQHAL